MTLRLHDSYRNIVSGSFFSNFFYGEGDGGVIFVDSSLFFFSVSKTVFSRCSVSYSNSKFGGAIYFSSNSGSFEIKRCCGEHCSAYRRGFLYSSLVGQCSNLNQVTQSSVFSCSNSTSLLYAESARLYYGVSDHRHNNFTECKTQTHVIFGSDSFSSTSFSYGCLINNSGDAQLCTWNSNNAFVSHSLFCYNNRVQQSYGLIHFSQSQNASIFSSIFFQNDMPLFDLYISGSLTIYNVTLDAYSYNSNHMSILTGTLTITSSAPPLHLLNICHRIQKSITCNLFKSNYLLLTFFLHLLHVSFV